MRLNTWLILILPVLFAVMLAQGVSAERSEVCNYLDNGYNYLFFYSDTCPHCKNVEASGVLGSLEKDFNITITRYLAGDNKDTFLKLCPYVKDKSFACLAVPTLFIVKNDKYGSQDLKLIAIQGDRPIRDGAKDKIKAFLVESSAQGNQSCEKDSIWKALPVVIVTGLTDSINPCIMSVLALLLIQISVVSTRRRIVKLGAIFSATVFLTYVAIGLLIMFVSELFIMKMGNSLSASIGSILLWLIVVLLAVAGIVNIKDFFWYGKGITFKIPEKYTGIVNSLIKKLSLPSILLLGVIITIIEFPCSGIMYVGVVGYLRAQFSSVFAIMVLLLLYNVLFILPLVIMIALTYYGTKPEHLDRIRLKYRALFRLIMGIALIGMAVFLIFNQGLI